MTSTDTHLKMYCNANNLPCRPVLTRVFTFHLNEETDCQREKIVSTAPNLITVRMLTASGTLGPKTNT